MKVSLTIGEFFKRIDRALDRSSGEDISFQSFDEMNAILTNPRRQPQPPWAKVLIDHGIIEPVLTKNVYRVNVHPSVIYQLWQRYFKNNIKSKDFMAQFIDSENNPLEISILRRKQKQGNAILPPNVVEILDKII